MDCWLVLRGTELLREPAGAPPVPTKEDGRGAEGWPLLLPCPPIPTPAMPPAAANADGLVGGGKFAPVEPGALLPAEPAGFLNAP